MGAEAVDVVLALDADAGVLDAGDELDELYLDRDFSFSPACAPLVYSLLLRLRATFSPFVLDDFCFSAASVSST